MVPEQILDSIDPSVANYTSVKRFIKTARRRFRSKSPNDVDHYLMLATAIYVLGDENSSIELLEFLDENTGEYTCGRVDLAGSLATARLVLAYIFEQRDEKEKFQSIMSREGLERSMNVNTVDPEYKNLIHESLYRNARNLKVHENDDESTRGYLLGFCWWCLVDLIVIKGRLADIKHTIDADDVVGLVNGIDHYRNKFVSYLGPK